MENANVFFGGDLGLNVVSHVDLVGLSVQELNNVVGKSALTVGVHIELYSFGNVEGNQGECERVVSLKVRRTIGGVEKSLEISIGEVYVSVKLHLLCREALEVLLKGRIVIDLGVASSTLNLRSCAVLVQRGNSAVIEAEGKKILHVAVESSLCYGECEEEKVCGRALVVSAIEKNLVYRFTVDLVAVCLSVAVDEEHLHSAVVRCQLLLPDLVVGAVNACIIGLGIITQDVGEVLNVLIIDVLVSASLNILDNYLFEAGGILGKGSAVLESIVDAKKIHVDGVNSVNVEAKVADLKEDHILALVCMDETRLDNNSAHVVDGSLSGSVYKGILLLFGVEGEDGDVCDLALIVILKILHQLSLLFEELYSETVVSPYEKLVCLVQNFVVHLLVESDGGQDINYSLKECVSALKV